MAMYVYQPNIAHESYVSSNQSHTLRHTLTMTGGIGYFYDEDGRFEERVNCEIVKVQQVATFS